MDLSLAVNTVGGLSSDSDDSDVLSSEEYDTVGELESNLNLTDFKLGISKDLARKNYEAAGMEVKEDSEVITVDDHADLIDPKIEVILNETLDTLQLPYKLSDFQRLSVNVAASMRHLIVVMPTGSGKMDIPLLSILVLKKKLKMPKGVVIITQPLTSIMNEKLSNKICKVAVLSMSGKLKTSASGNEEDETNLSCDLEDLLDGKYDALFGHPESFASKLGMFILKELQRRGLLLLVCIDEVHQVNILFLDSLI